MAVITSSTIGANLNSSDATALFTLGTSINATGGSYFQYCQATATFTTGALVYISPAGTAIGATTALLASNTNGYDLGVVQYPINQGENGWIARKGSSLYVKCTGTLSAGQLVAMAAAAGRVQDIGGAGVGQTLQGVWVTTTISGGTQAAVCTLLWPKGQANA